MDGVIEFIKKNAMFYKSSLEPDFFNYIGSSLKGAHVLRHGTFQYIIETKPLAKMDTCGDRLLTLKKI